MSRLEKCFLLNVAYYFQSFDDIKNLVLVSHNTCIENFFLTNPTCLDEKSLFKFIQVIQHMETIQAPLEFLSKYHKHIQRINNIKTQCNELNNNTKSYLNYIASKVSALDVSLDSTSFCEHFTCLPNMQHLKSLVLRISSDFSFDYIIPQHLPHKFELTIFTPAQCTKQIVQFVNSLKDNFKFLTKFVVYFIDEVEELSLALLRSIDKTIQVVCCFNKLHISLIKERAFLVPYKYHLVVPIDFPTTENIERFKRMVDSYDVPFFQFGPTSIDEDQIDLDLRDIELYSLVIPCAEFPKLDVLLPTSLLSLTVGTPQFTFPVLPNLLELNMIFCDLENFLFVPESVTGLTVVQATNLVSMNFPEVLRNLVLVNLPNFARKSLTTTPLTNLCNCEIRNVKVDIPMICTLKRAILENVNHIAGFPIQMESLIIKHMELIPELPSNIIKLVLAYIDCEVVVPENVKYLGFNNCDKIVLPHKTINIEIPFASKIPKLCDVISATIFGNEVSEMVTTVVELSLSRCSLFPHCLDNCKHLTQLVLRNCVAKDAFPTLKLKELSVTSSPVPPLNDDLENIFLCKVNLEEIKVPQNVTKLQLACLSTLKRLFTGEKLKDLEIGQCNHLKSINLPLKIENVSIEICENCCVNNAEMLHDIPYGQYLYLCGLAKGVSVCN
ncbi:hypothetical protein EIN_372360 [Entamoeba invadens IP1]|uniref:Leucine-rich repeat containing protein n=1 Tax=Entamoeba invadens IP1 TaxID=370355 RepID=A0A0A1UFP1_ENTIV|nr:hypothetical protein EIN_372360 [Entamoeba invadens IP1]ELP92814.1 hypothetical protein EIN_372360 [Entamoeba invadens IP1]|eukprot:XP_004259585.1 hypothetical protein EIN_372360 [Entamoeba invadens IP1]